MNPEMLLNLRNCAAQRAHIAGAKAARLEAAAKEARRRYFRELATVDFLAGDTSFFSELGQ